MFKKYELTIYEIGILKILFFIAKLLASANDNKNVYSHKIEDNLNVFENKLPRRLCTEWSLPKDYDKKDEINNSQEEGSDQNK